MATFLITGASRGLGKAIAVQAATHYHENDEQRDSLKFVLISRSTDGLEETKNEILKICPGIQVDCYPIDLSDLDFLDDQLNPVLTKIQQLQPEKLVFINNAGSLGHLGSCTMSTLLQDMKQTIDLNVTSSLWMSVRVAQLLLQQQQQQQQTENSDIKSITIVNISSLVAISDDFVTMGLYSAGKAAREKYHTILAKEEQYGPIKVLNYAPGPLETNMAQELRHSTLLDKNLQENFKQPLIDPNDSALKLIRLLQSNEFETGSHVDYYDLP
jgi:sepiapterin reductase